MQRSVIACQMMPGVTPLRQALLPIIVIGELPDMPYVTISASQSYSAEQKHQLIASASDAVVSSLQAPVENVRVLLNEYPTERYLVAGQSGAPMVMYLVELIEGRDDTKKATLTNTLKRAAVQATGIDIGEVKVRFLDFRPEDMGRFPLE